MAESKPSIVLNVLNNSGNDNQQQYVEVGSNMFVGTKDGIKYTLVKTSDSKYRLVEALSDSNASLDFSKSYSTAIKDENPTQFNDGRDASTKEPKIIKLMGLKHEQSPCKGQGDEIGNSVVSPLSISSFKEPENVLVEKVTFEETPTDQDSSSHLTYTTLLPKQNQKETWSNTYFPTPPSTHCNYSTTFPPPVAIRPKGFAKRGRPPLSTVAAPFSPIPRMRMCGRGQRRPRRRAYQYTPQILHSTPNKLPSLNASSDMSLTDNLSGSQNTSSFCNVSQSSIEYPRVPNNTPDSAETNVTENQKIFTIQWVPSMESGSENYISMDPRETHNEKERVRRLRIKNACQSMRNHLPYLIDKIDNASVFEEAVYFISFMRETVGNEHDIEFIEKNYIF